MSKRIPFFMSLFLFLALQLSGQEYFRLRAEFTVKISNSDGTKNLTRGSVFYDKKIKHLIYNINFPQKEQWISKDTSLIKVKNGEIYERRTIPSINEFTVFHLSLNSDLNDFGLKNSVYKVSKVEKKGDLVLSYWKIPAQASKIMDHIIIARKGNRLESVIIVGDQQKILSKQFYRNYEKINAFEFPTQIIQVLYDQNGGENYQVTEFKNIIVNDMSNNALYQINLKNL